MRRLNEKNINTPEYFNEWFKKFRHGLGVTDLPRFERLAKYFTDGVYVDVGVWDSPMPLILSERYPKAEIHALDFAGSIINFLKGRIPKVKYQHIDSCLSLPFGDNSVDYVVAGEIIEHMEEPKALVKECRRILKPGGWLAISTPHIEHEKADRIGGPAHLWSFDKQDLVDLGFSEIETIQEDRCLTWLAWQQK